MTKHQDVNKCRRQEKYKWLPYSGKLTCGYEMTNKPKIKKRERTHGEKEGEERERKQRFLKRNWRQVMSASNGTKAGYT